MWFFEEPEPDTRLQRRPVPSGNKSGQHGLIPGRRNAQKIDDWYPVLKCFQEPSIVGSARVLAHEGVVDRLIALEYLAMDLALVVVPDPGSRLRKYGFD